MAASDDLREEVTVASFFFLFWISVLSSITAVGLTSVVPPSNDILRRRGPAMSTPRIRAERLPDSDPQCLVRLIPSRWHSSVGAMELPQSPIRLGSLTPFSPHPLLCVRRLHHPFSMTGAQRILIRQHLFPRLRRPAASHWAPRQIGPFCGFHRHYLTLSQSVHLHRKPPLPQRCRCKSS